MLITDGYNRDWLLFLQASEGERGVEQSGREKKTGGEVELVGRFEVSQGDHTRGGERAARSRREKLMCAACVCVCLCVYVCVS